MEFLVKLTTNGVCMKKEKGVSSCERTGMGGAEMYNVYFEMASMCFLLLMLIIIKLKRQLNILQNKVFITAIYIMLILNLLDTASAVVLNAVKQEYPLIVPVWVMYATMIIIFIGQQVILELFLLYIMMNLHKNKKKPKVLYALNILSVFYYLSVLTTPFTKYVFYFNKEDGTYIHGEFWEIVYIVPACFLLSIIILFSKRMKHATRTQKMVILGSCVSTFLEILLQYLFFTNCLFAYFWGTLVLAAIFFSLQSPDFYIDRTTHAFNHDGLMVMMGDRMDRNKPFSILFLQIIDFENIQGGFCNENKRKVYSELCSSLFRMSKVDVFRDDDKIYIMFHESEKGEEYAALIQKKITEGIEISQINSKVKIVAKMLLFDYPGRIMNEEEFHSVIRYFMTDPYYKRYNVVQFINEEFFRKKKRYEDVRHLVEEAIRTDGIEMYYQPIYSTQKKNFHSAEALVRLRDKNTIGFVSPEEFIPIAEKEHLILQLEDLILRKVCQFIRDARLQHIGLEYIEVNLSGNQCVQEDLYEQLERLIREYGITPSFINFEVTETSTIENNERLITNMEHLQSFGSTFSLDDYGSGASNLKYLVDFPFEIVKLDKSIVWTYFGSKNRKTRSVLPSSVSMLREMNVKIVAEGVETEEQCYELTRMGVQYLQGYYFSKPVCEREFVQFIKKQNEESKQKHL